ncbi:MAG: YigZ family protein, partial [Muribaculaceae bacterium]|nr:YigZ family protein [Muribaculaceae bacterium]
MNDIYYTIKGSGSSQYKEKMSRFLSFAVPVTNAEEAKAEVKKYQNEYHDSRHVCWAYMIGADRMEWQLNDNGEPSGTAGKPILGQINSFNVTDVLIIVVRY